MPTSSHRIVARFLTSVTMAPFDGRRVQQLQRDAEKILQNYDRVNTEQDHDRLRLVINDWRNKLRKDVDAMVRYLRDFALTDPSVKNIDRQLSEWRKKLQPLTDLQSKIDIPSWEYWVEPQTKARWKRELETAIAALPPVGVWLDALRKKKKIAPETPDVFERNQNLEGFDSKLIGFDENDPEHIAALVRFSEGLREYKKQAAKWFPDLVRKKLPLELRFDVVDMMGSAGNYGPDKLTFYPMNLGKSVTKVVHVVSHEMAHHFGISLLSGGARAFWIQMVKGDWGDFDLRELLKRWSPNENEFDLLRESKTKDPIFYLQFEGLLFGNIKLPKQLTDNFTRDTVKTYLEGGGNPMVRVPQTPITAYGSTNPDEAFAEAVSMVITYGPQAVHEKVRYWLNVVLPGQFKASSTTRDSRRR